MLLKVLFIALCVGLWRLGGWDKAKWSGYRDVLVPIALGLWCGFNLVWWSAILVAGAAQIIRMGYGSYDPEHDDKPSFLAKVTHDREGYIIRLIVGAVRALVVGVVICAISGHWFRLAAYVIQCGLVSFIACRAKAKDYVIEPLEGAAFSSAILWLA